MRLSGPLPRYAVLLLLFVAAAFFIWLPHYLEWKWDYGVVHGIGEALAVAVFLSFTIEKWFREDFAEDVFQAGLGAALRPEFRGELRWLTSFKWLARDARCRVKIEDVGNGVVKFTLEVEREYENISSEPQEIQGYIGVDEWGFAGFKSSIEKCGLIKDGKTIQASEKNDGPDGTHPNWKTRKVLVDPGKTVRTFSKAIEYRRTNDQHVLSLVHPVKDPEVELDVSDSLEGNVGFTHRGEANTEPLRGKKTLRGTLLPSQVIIFRWWPK